MTLGDTLRHLRQVYGLSLRDLERQSGSSNTYLTLLGQDKRMPGWGMLQRLAQGFGLSATALVAHLECHGALGERPGCQACEAAAGMTQQVQDARHTEGE